MKTQTRWVVFLFLVSSVVAGCGPGARAPAPASTASAISWGGQTYHEIPGTVSGCTMTFCVEGVPCHACLGDLSGCTPFSGCTDPANTLMGAGELCSTDGCVPSGCFPAYCDLWTGDCVVCDDGDPATEEQCINDPLSPCHFVPKGGPDEAVPDVPVPQDLPVIPEVVVPFDLPGLDVAGLRDLIVLPDLPVPVDYVPGEDVPGEDVQEVLDVAGREDTPAVFDVPPLEDVPGVPDTPVIPDVPAGEDLPGTVDVPGAEDVPLPSDPGMPTDTSVSDVTPPADVFIPGDAGGDACVPPDGATECGPGCEEQCWEECVKECGWGHEKACREECIDECENPPGDDDWFPPQAWEGDEHREGGKHLGHPDRHDCGLHKGVEMGQGWHGRGHFKP